MAKTQVIGVKLSHKQPVSKRTSIGGKHNPLNKHKRRQWKKYRAQGPVSR